MQAALDNFWNFIQMNYSDPGWSNTNGDVTDLRSMHLLPVCGLWIICGPVGPRSSDLFVKEFDKKGSCITVNTPISSKNPFTVKEEETSFFNMSFQKDSKEKALWLTGVVDTWRKSFLKWVPAKYTEVDIRCKWLMVSKVRFLFWCLQMDFITWAVIITDYKRGRWTIFSL